MRISRETSILNVESRHSFMTSQTHIRTSMCVRARSLAQQRFGYVIYVLKLVYTKMSMSMCYVLSAG